MDVGADVVEPVMFIPPPIDAEGDDVVDSNEYDDIEEDKFTWKIENGESAETDEPVLIML